MSLIASSPITPRYYYAPAAATLKRVDEWLIQNALAEAEARGDTFNALSFITSLDYPQQADKDLAE